MSDNGSQRQGETPQELTFMQENAEIRKLPALGLTLGNMFSWQPNVTERRRRLHISDTKVARNWEDPEGEESSEGESDVQDN
jgi:hypothetical protein